MIGRTLSHHRIVEPLRPAGGMGEVYRPHKTLDADGQPVLVGARLTREIYALEWDAP